MNKVGQACMMEIEALLFWLLGHLKRTMNIEGNSRINIVITHPKMSWSYYNLLSKIINWNETKEVIIKFSLWIFKIDPSDWYKVDDNLDNLSML